jgi:hypothetical protein
LKSCLAHERCHEKVARQKICSQHLATALDLLTGGEDLFEKRLRLTIKASPLFPRDEVRALHRVPLPCLSLISWFPTILVSTRARCVDLILSANFFQLFPG